MTGFAFWFLVGGVAGFTTGILFLRNDKRFWDKVTTWAPNLAVLGTGVYLNWADSSSPLREISIFFILQVVGWIIAFFLTIYLACKKSNKYNINIADIFFGQHLKKIDEDSQRKNLAQEWKKIQEEKERITQEEKDIDKVKRLLNNQKKGTICFNLVSEEKNIPVSYEHLTTCPKYALRISRMAPYIKEASHDAIEELEESIDSEKGKDQKVEDIIETTRALLQLVSVYLNKYLIKEEGCRVHFRVQAHEGKYKKFVATIGSEPVDYMEDLKVIPYEGSMIEKSFDNRAPTIKSLNQGSHIPGNNDGRWPEYITVAFDELTINKRPLVSMGISFPHPEMFSDFANYLCQIRFDWIIKDLLSDYFNYLNGQDEVVKSQALKKMMES